MKKATYTELLNRSIAEAMSEDNKIVLIGKGVTTGGDDGIAKGFYGRFGNDRVVDGTADDKANIRLAAGLAAAGALPVVIVNGMNLFSCMNAIVLDVAMNEFATNSQYKSRMVICADIGHLEGDCPGESFLDEGVFLGISNLTVVYPSCPEDAANMMKSILSESSGGPVLFLMARSMKKSSAESDNERKELIGKAEVIKEGDDMTLITYGPMVEKCMEASYRAMEAGIECELIDLKSLSPLDEKTLVASLTKTGKAIIVQEAHSKGGLADIIISLLVRSEAFDYLEAPFKVIATPPGPVAYNDFTGKSAVPGWEDIYEAIISMV